MKFKLISNKIRLNKRPVSRTAHMMMKTKEMKNTIKGKIDKKPCIILLDSGYGLKTLNVLLKILADKFLETSFISRFKKEKCR